MNKETKKNSRPQYNRDVIETLVLKYGLSDYYIRQSVSGRKQGITPDKIKADYKKLDSALNVKKQEFLNK